MSRDNQETDWQPAADQDVLIARANMLAGIRSFFQQRSVLEVDTPSLSQGTITDVYLEPLSSSCQSIDEGKQSLYLQTSPEFAMKRLLAAGSGCIYQICRAFRDDEMGRFHNPEFLMLEWYRIGFDHQKLMVEMDELLAAILNTEPSDTISYQELFLQRLKIDPLSCSDEDLQSLVFDKANGPKLEQRDEMLHCLFSILIEPELGIKRPLMVFDFPASQSALAKLSNTDPRVASRFEVYYQGVELANGFHELQDAEEQRQRFIEDNQQRKLLGKQQRKLDERFLAALENGLPDCAGVALGLDRLLMLKLEKKAIAQVMTFPIDRA
ncbi:MAG: elongation factor P lysine(34) lysyltransferase [Gammaproteobacteria bacterium]|nr:MAG: elongation factor P lysine(34) lysyltransferase [Gammaproteobacteria bacterium]